MVQKSSNALLGGVGNIDEGGDRAAGTPVDDSNAPPRRQNLGKWEGRPRAGEPRQTWRACRRRCKVDVQDPYPLDCDCFSRIFEATANFALFMSSKTVSSFSRPWSIANAPKNPLYFAVLRSCSTKP